MIYSYKKVNTGSPFGTVLNPVKFSYKIIGERMQAWTENVQVKQEMIRIAEKDGKEAVTVRRKEMFLLAVNASFSF